MCTVSYLPKEKGNFILTSNRDEAPARHGNGLLKTQRNDRTIFYPDVPNTPGSWISVSDRQQTVCLLNGAFDPSPNHRRYPKSRGNVILDFFEFESTAVFASDYQMDGMAPFTLVVLEDGQCFKLIWDGTQTFLEELDATIPHFWSSVTLYPPDIRKWRENLFREWLRGRTSFSQEEILAFHTSGGAEDMLNGLLMNRNDIVKTLSVTTIRKEEDFFELRYIDLENGPRPEQKIRLSPASELFE